MSGGARKSAAPDAFCELGAIMTAEAVVL